MSICQAEHGLNRDATVSCKQPRGCGHSFRTGLKRFLLPLALQVQSQQTPIRFMSYVHCKVRGRHKLFVIQRPPTVAMLQHACWTFVNVVRISVGTHLNDWPTAWARACRFKPAGSTAQLMQTAHHRLVSSQASVHGPNFASRPQI